MSNDIYVVFSSTPTGMGRLIRWATRNRYNHVSLSFERDIHKMYSFARYHRDIPLYGGFVTESILRYSTFAGRSQVKICRLPVEEPSFTYLRNYIDRLWSDREVYLYNTPAAVASLVHRAPAIAKSYTCVTFVHEILCRCRIPGAERIACPTVRALERLLSPYVAYEGSALPLTVDGQWGEDEFPAQTTARYAVYTTVRHFGRLAGRILRGTE